MNKKKIKIGLILVGLSASFLLFQNAARFNNYSVRKQIPDRESIINRGAVIRNNAPAPQPVQQRSISCQSPSFCVHSEMPIYAQNYWGLIQYVNAREGTNLQLDGGWCGGISAAMIFKTIKNQTQKTFGNFVDNTDYLEFQYLSMKHVRTGIRSGGTTDGNARNGLRDIASKANGQADYSGWVGISEFRRKMPLMYLHASGGRAGHHAIVVNGVEGNAYKIFDPWGRIYTATMENGGLRHFGGEGGFVHNANNGAGVLAKIEKVIQVKNYISVR
jgi:hypothetical protein